MVKEIDVVEVLERSVADTDPEVRAALAAELRRQQGTLEMIASENFAPVSVMQAQGSVLTNNYAEGYPGRRYYGGCEHVDVSEQLAVERFKSLADIIASSLKPDFDEEVRAVLGKRVAALTEKVPLHPNLDNPSVDNRPGAL